MTKERTARVIPNAIQICTATDKYFFTSFGARDKTYLMLFRVWQNALMDQVKSILVYKKKLVQEKQISHKRLFLFSEFSDIQFNLILFKIIFFTTPGKKSQKIR